MLSYITRPVPGSVPFPLAPGGCHRFFTVELKKDSLIIILIILVNIEITVIHHVRSNISGYCTFFFF